MEDLLQFEDEKPVLAKKRVRVLAIVIDYAIFIVVFFILTINFGEKILNDNDSIGYQLTGFPAFVCFLFWFILLPGLEGLKGQTVGKMICKIQVLQVDYEKATFMQCIIRHLFDFVDYLPALGIVGLLVSSNNPLKQRVGDLVVKTIVIQK